MRNKLLAVFSAISICISITGCNDSKSSDNSSDLSNETSSISQNTKQTAEYVTKIFGQDVLNINITATEENWNNLIENAVSKPWISGNIEINGETFNNVGIKTKGNTSLTQISQSDNKRFSLKVNFGKYEKEQSCYGLDKLVLNNIYSDNTYLKEYMSYELFEYMNVPCSLHTFAKITVNGEYYGFFLALEDTDDSFLDRNYGEDNDVAAYKPESMEMNGEKFNGERPQMPENGEIPQFPQMPEMSGDKPDFGERPQMPENGDAPQFPQGDFNRENGKNGMDGGTGGVNLVYKDDEISSYNNIFDNNITKVDEDDKKRLIKSLKGISESENIEEFINVDEVLRYLACNVFLTNLDSYLGSNCHNYILTEDNGKLSMLPWDYNLSFGTYQCSSSSDAINYAIDTVFSGVSAEDRPLIGKLLEKQEYVDLYHSYLKQICEEYVQSGIFEKTINNAVSVISDYVKNDSTSFCSYDEFEKGVDALKLFGKLRAESVLGQLDGSIPSTSEAQKNSSALIDASALDLNALGGMNMDKNFPNKGDFPKKSDINR